MSRQHGIKAAGFGWFVLSFLATFSSPLVAPASDGRIMFDPRRLWSSFILDGQSSRKILPELGSPIITANGNETLFHWKALDGDLNILQKVKSTNQARHMEVRFTLGNASEIEVTPIIQDIHSLDYEWQLPSQAKGKVYLHRTNGAPSNPTDFMPSVVEVTQDSSQHLGGGAGRSSNKDFPFFKLEAGDCSLIIAVGWSGQWQATITRIAPDKIRITAGLEKTHFKLLPGESVTLPRILLFQHKGDTLEANAQFRQLIYQHYCAKRADQKMLPMPYCNTCFTRGGAWLNECNAENQISLINAFAPLGLEALLTDAGWFEGGWPAGAGNWTPRKDAYPDGMRPVAAAAKARDMIYGLWFEPERVVANTAIHKQHPDWLLHSQDGPEDRYLLNFGLPEVQDYFFNIVKEFMELPGFRVYRQDFNMNPLPYWRFSDAPDRQGITEIRYIQGLYAYWERIGDTWPDALLIECSSGGRRIDLETLRRMHIHQKSDYWFRNEVDQTSIYGLSQYLPNNVFMAPVNRLDDYSFNSAMTTSLCLGWIADAPDFDVARARQLLERYHAIRHLMIGAWYPLLPCSQELTQWMASQYHRPDLDEGFVLIFRRAECDQASQILALKSLAPNAEYELTHLDGQTERQTGEALIKGLQVQLKERPATDLIRYKRVDIAAR